MGVLDTAQGLGRRAGAALGNAGRTVRAKAGEGDWVRRALASVPAPESPAEESWELSLAAMIGTLPKVPGPAVRLLHQLDGLGQVVFGPERIGFDDEDVEWSRVTELRLHSTAELLPDVVVDKEVDRIREFLPPVPGRKWLVGKIAEGLLTLVLTAAEAAVREERMLPCEVVYRSRLGRPKQLGGGLFAAAALAARPDAAKSLIATAEALGIPVVTVEPTGTRADRAQRLRATSARIQDRLRSLRSTSADIAESVEPAEAPAELPATPHPEIPAQTQPQAPTSPRLSLDKAADQG
ncbi:hypothetical protein [Kitasatospora camelliae]|uniref:Uncharacterized protein n=1 Tax=Kitasatospora camelliae TaxID=3156397 RepID=A0AAU8JWK1_9ACTN